MIPTFPDFKKLEINDKPLINPYTHQCKPYSDFNFTNLWAWDTNERRQISELNGNLVVLFTDYITAEPILSFLGSDKEAETAREIISYAEKNEITPTLRFVTEEVADTLKSEGFNVEADENSFDYIFSVSQLAEPNGPGFKKKRQLASRFTREHPEALFEEKTLNDAGVREQIFSIFSHWRKERGSDTKYDLKLEETALRRILETAQDHTLVISCVYKNEIMLGFSIDELLADGYAISHFVKANTSYKGVYEFLNHMTAKHLQGKGVHLWNWEQDLNIEGLRRLKQSYRPVDFLKKYNVSL